MTDDNLPVDPVQGGERLPARHEPAGRRALAPLHGQGALSLFEAEAEDEASEFDLRKYWHILLKWRWLVISIAAAVTAMALVKTLTTTPMYSAQALVQIDTKPLEVSTVTGSQTTTDVTWDDEYLQTQLELLKSRSLSERVASRLNLDQAALDRLEDPGWFSRLMGMIRPRPAPTAAPRRGSTTAGQASAIRDAVAGEVGGGLSVSRVDDTRLVWIRYDSPSPDFAVQVANAVAEEFIASNQEHYSGRSNFAKTYLEEQLAATKAKLEASERKMVEYARAQGLTITDEDGRTLALESLTQLSTALAQAQQERIRAEARYRNNATSADQLNASAIGPLQQQRAVLMSQYQQKLATFKPDYPEMLQLKQQIDEIDKQIGAERGRVGGSVRAEYEAAVAEESALSAKVEQLRSQAFVASSSSIEYNILKRDVDTNRELYNGLLQRYKEIGATSESTANNISVVDPAIGAGRFKPDVRQDLMRGVLFGLLLGVLAAFLLEYLDDTLKAPHDIEQKLRLAVLGVVPKVEDGKRIADVAADPTSAFSESYRSVRAALQFSTDHGVPRTLLVTSAGAGEGKSTASLALARNFARLGKSVLLVEGDLRNPSMHRNLGLKTAATGLSGLLSGSEALSAVVQPSGEDNLQVILAGPLPPNPAELLSGSKLISMLTVAVERYDQIIIDGPPVLGLADAPILSNAVDGTVLIVDAGRTKIRTAQMALKRLMAARARVVGALLSRYDTKQAAYGYGYGYGYNYDYGRGSREGKLKLTKG